MKTVTRTSYLTKNQCRPSMHSHRSKPRLRIKAQLKKQSQLASVASSRRLKRKSCSWSKRDNGSRGLRMKGGSEPGRRTLTREKRSPMRGKRKRSRSSTARTRSTTSRTTWARVSQTLRASTTACKAKRMRRTRATLVNSLRTT